MERIFNPSSCSSHKIGDSTTTACRLRGGWWWWWCVSWLCLLFRDTCGHFVGSGSLGKLARTRRENRDPLESNGIFSLCMEVKRSPADTKALLKASAQLLDFMKVQCRCPLPCFASVPGVVTKLVLVGCSLAHLLACVLACLCVQGFIDETNPVYPRKWNHRVWYFRVFNIPPEFVTGSVAVGDSSRMYGDPNVRWESILFRGVELDLMVFNILVRAVLRVCIHRTLLQHHRCAPATFQTFAIGMLMFSDTVVSTIFVFCMESVLGYVRWTMGMVGAVSFCKVPVE